MSSVGTSRGHNDDDHGGAAAEIDEYDGDFDNPA